MGRTRGWRGLVVASVVGVVGVAGAAAPVVRRVDDSSCPVAAPVYCTIQEAIDAATPGDTILVKAGGDGAYKENILINKRVNVVAGGDVTIHGTACTPRNPTVTMSGNGGRLQGFRVINGCDANILVTGNDNVVAANRVGPDATGTTGIVLGDGAQRNVIVANVVTGMTAGDSDGIGIRIDSSAGPNNLILHNVVARNEDTGITINASKTTLIGNVVTDNGLGDGGDGIDIDSPGVRGTSLKGNVALQNGGNGNPSDHDIEMHPQSQRPVLKGNTYEKSGVQE